MAENGISPFWEGCLCFLWMLRRLENKSVTTWLWSRRLSFSGPLCRGRFPAWGPSTASTRTPLRGPRLPRGPQAASWSSVRLSCSTLRICSGSTAGNSGKRLTGCRGPNPRCKVQSGFLKRLMAKKVGNYVKTIYFFDQKIKCQTKNTVVYLSIPYVWGKKKRE